MKIVYIDDISKIIPGYGEFSKGDTVEHNEILLSTGLFEVVEEKTTLEKGAK